MNSNGKIIFALLAGAAAGAALGVLFAPAKGQETRKQVSGSAKRIAETLKAKVQNGLGSLSALTQADNEGEMSSPTEAGRAVKQHV
jgi:gas vesicle protein